MYRIYVLAAAALLSVLNATASLERANEATALLGDEIPYGLFNEDGYIWEEKGVSSCLNYVKTPFPLPGIVIYPGVYFEQSGSIYYRKRLPLLGEECVALKSCYFVASKTGQLEGRSRIFYFVESEGGWVGWVDNGYFMPVRTFGRRLVTDDIVNDIDRWSVYGHIYNLKPGDPPGEYPSGIVGIIVGKILDAPELQFEAPEFEYEEYQDSLPQSFDLPTFQSQALCWGGERLLNEYFTTDYRSDNSYRLLIEYGKKLREDYANTYAIDSSPFGFPISCEEEGIMFLKEGYTGLGLKSEFEKYIEENIR